MLVWWKRLFNIFEDWVILLMDVKLLVFSISSDLK